MKKEDSAEYELFYMELPQTTDHLYEFQYEDEVEEIPNTPNEGNARQGLSEEQVSQIASDSLTASNKTISTIPEDSNLFSDNSSTH